MSMIFDTNKTLLLATNMGKRPGLALIQDPGSFRVACETLGIPFPQYGTLNHYRNMLGPGPGTGQVLMLRQDLDIAMAADYGALRIQSPGLVECAFTRLTVDTAECLAPAATGDPESMFLVKFVDRRAEISRLVLDKAYNLRDSHGEYCPETLKPGGGSGSGGSSGGSGGSGSSGGSPWKWSEMIADIWKKVTDVYPDLKEGPSGPLGASNIGFPNLVANEFGDNPFEVTPDEYPEGFDFYGQPAWQSLNVVMSRLGLAMRYNNLAVNEGTGPGMPRFVGPKDYFDFVRIGNTLSGHDSGIGSDSSNLARRDGLTIWNADPQTNGRNAIPGKLKVMFRALPCGACDPIRHVQDREIPVFFTFDEDGKEINYDRNATAIIWDDLYARYDSIGLSNPGELTARADERRDDFYRVLIDGNVLARQQVLLSGCIATLPNSKVKEVVWAHRGESSLGGTTTALMNTAGVLPPYGLWDDWFVKPRQDPCDCCDAELFARITGQLPKPTGSGSGTSGSSGGPGLPRGPGGGVVLGSGGTDLDPGGGGPTVGGSGSGSGSGSGGGCKWSWIGQQSTLMSCGLFDSPTGPWGYIDHMPAIGMRGQAFNVGDLVQLTLGTTGDHYIALTVTRGTLQRIELLTGSCLVATTSGAGSGGVS